MEVLDTCFFFFSSRRRHTRFDCDWSSDVCSSDLCKPACAVRPEAGQESELTNRRADVRRQPRTGREHEQDRKSTRLNSSHSQISYAVFCLKKKYMQMKK